MAGLNIGDVIECNVNYAYQDQLYINTFPYRITQASAELNVTNACLIWAEDWVVGAVSPFTALKNLIAQNVTISSVSVQKIEPVRYRRAVHVLATPGLYAFDAATGNVAATITRAAEMSGRRYVGSIHIPALAQNAMETGTISLDYKALMSTVGARMLNEFTAGTDGLLRGVPVLIHRVWNPETEKWQYDGNTQLWTSIPQEQVRTMRRRTIGLGV